VFICGSTALFGLHGGDFVCDLCALLRPRRRDLKAEEIRHGQRGHRPSGLRSDPTHPALRAPLFIEGISFCAFCAFCGQVAVLADLLSVRICVYLWFNCIVRASLRGVSFLCLLCFLWPITAGHGALGITRPTSGKGKGRSTPGPASGPNTLHLTHTNSNVRTWGKTRSDGVRSRIGENWRALHGCYKPRGSAVET
jgi:hypothetical protein